MGDICPRDDNPTATNYHHRTKSHIATNYHQILLILYDAFLSSPPTQLKSKAKSKVKSEKQSQNQKQYSHAI